MLNNNDRLTSIFKEKIDEAKRTTAKNQSMTTTEAAGNLAGILLLAAAKTALVALAIWLGAKSFCEYFHYEPPTYIQILTITVAIRSGVSYFFEQPKTESN